MKPKKAGRPRRGKEARQSYSVRLQPHVAERIRRHGEGSLAEGIDRLAATLK